MAGPIRKLPYIDPAGAARLGALPVRPPFLFSGVTARVFPLRADMARLTRFCDQYLNMDIPPHIVHFRPALPYVYLMVLDYGSMSAASVQAQNVGWVAQHEVAFAVPLQRWRAEKGALVFKDWACVSPFIYVDDEMSMTTGREVYGWPKVAGRVQAEAPMWAQHPRAGTRLFTFSAPAFPRVYAGEAETLRVLLQIDIDPAPAYAELPPDLANPWLPVSVLNNAVRSTLSLCGSALDMALALRMRGYRTNRNAAALRSMAAKAGSYLSEFLPDLLRPLAGRQDAGDAVGRGLPKLAFANITLKQFRDAQEPDQACYKALVTSSMGLDRLNQSGLLGDVNLLRGDTSGGYSIRIHRYASQPIIESLGLEVAASEEQPDGGSVAILKPTFPFWTDVDLYYGEGQLICSRTHAQDEGQGDAWVDEQPDAVVPPDARDAPPNQGETLHGAYNTALGAATQPVAGPFHFPDVTVQVYPLLADRAQLEAFLAQYLNETLESAGLRFETFGSYVYAIVNVTGDQHGTMWSSANNIGWWAEREVSFCVPVKWFHRAEAGGAWELVSIGMVAPFVYASNGRAVITDREVNGRPSVRASIDSPADVWLARSGSGPVEDRRLLHMATEVFPALNMGQKGEERTLLEIDQRDVLPYNADVPWRLVAETWGRELSDDLKRKTHLRAAQAAAVTDAKALALEILTHEAPINWIVLKQYRDAADVDKACYQAAVHTRRSITSIYDIREIEERVHLRLHKLPGHPIAAALGLKLKSIDSVDGNVIENLQPLRPFWMRVAIKEELGSVIAVRAADGGWSMTHPWFAKRPDAPPAADAAAAPGDTPAEAAAAPDCDAAADAPYFCRPAAGHVGAALGDGTLHRNLKDAANGWLRKALTGEMDWIKKPQPAQRARLTAAVAQACARLEQAPDLQTWADAQSIDELMTLADAFPQARGAQPREQRRLTHAEARSTIAALDDVQLVVESILKDEWEDWGNPRWNRNTPRKPEQCIPSNSLYGGSWLLNRNMALFLQTEGLVQADDPAWLVVATEAQQAERVRRARVQRAAKSRATRQLNADLAREKAEGSGVAEAPPRKGAAARRR